MRPRWRSLVRSLVIAAGAAVTIVGVLSFRSEDWRIYLAFVLISAAVFLPYVEVLPRVALAIPDMAVTISFLYIGGLPIIALRSVAPILMRLLRWGLPERWKERLPQLEALSARRELLADGWTFGAGPNASFAAEWATFSLGLATRWWIVARLVPGAPPATQGGPMAVAEVGGYACWWALSVLPIYAERPLIAWTPTAALGAAFTDIGLIVILALTPFVFLIAYGFQVYGLQGAAAWSLSALGLHFMLKRLNERRLIVEEQNERLEALNRELEHRERLSAIGKMSSVVSHQILQQLGVIGIYADLVRNADAHGDPGAVLAQARKNAAAIEGAVRDVNRVLTDLLVFSKDLRLNLYQHPLERVLTECLAECQAEATARGVSLRMECPADIVVMLDKLKIKQAVTNVLRNAVEASPAAGEILVKAAVRDGQVDISIADQGSGIPARDREAVFTPFFTTKEHGTGLGLAIAREFTEAHGGQLRAQSDGEGGGATFVFSLPMRHSLGIADQS